MKNVINNFSKKLENIKFKNTIFTRIFPIVIFLLIVFVFIIINYIFNNYKEAFKVDLEGYMLNNNSSIELLKSSNLEDLDVSSIKRVNVKSSESIYSNSLNYYVDEKKNGIDITYPLFSSDGLSLVNYNENINLINNFFQRNVGYSNLLLSYGTIYDVNNYEECDKERYILLEYENGIFINLYDLKIKTLTNTYNIPTNSFIYFTGKKVNYFERTDDGFVAKEIIDIDLKSEISFYYDFKNEVYEYNYEDFLQGIGTFFKKVEIVKEEIEEKKDTETVDPSDDNDKRVEDIKKEDEIEWVKPEISTTPLIPFVYTASANISISDPAGVVIKAPSYTFYVNDKIYSRRTYYSSGDILITGLSPNTTFKVVGQYTYLDSDLVTKKVVTFYVDEITTYEYETLSPISLSFENGKIYSNKIELNNFKMSNDKNSDALYGIKRIAIKVNNQEYFLSSGSVSSLIKGNTISAETSESLKSNSFIDYEIVLYDVSSNKMKVVNNTGSTRTSKKEPTVVLKLKESETDHVTIAVNLKNADDVVLNDYRYVVYNTGGTIVYSNAINDSSIRLENLDPDQIFNIKIYSSYDINDNTGLKEDVLMSEMDFTSIPITSLGYLNINTEVIEITDNNANLSFSINKNKTNEKLVRILSKLDIYLYDDNSKLIYIKNLSDDEIARLKAHSNVEMLFDNLNSNSKYKIVIKSVVAQGGSTYDLDCIHEFNQFETRKIPAKIFVANSFVNTSIIDFDCLAVDPDNSILSNYVRVELRNQDKRIISSKTIEINSDDYIRLSYSNLNVNENYTITFTADEYNETNDNSTYKAKHELLKLDLYTDEGISGKIQLVSSLRIGNSENIADVYSESKWIETVNYYTIPKVVDDEGDMHIYSKNGASSYTYDLTEYSDKLVTASFKVKAINPVKNNYKVYFTNYIYGTTSSSYGIELKNITTDNWTTYTYTFKVGSYNHSSCQRFVPNAGLYYGKNIVSFAGFYITGGTSDLAEYEIRDLEMHLASKNEEEMEVPSIEQGGYNSSGTKYNSTTRVKTSSFIELEAGYYYTIEFDNTSAYAYHYKTTGSYIRADGWFASGATIYATINEKIGLMFLNGDGSLPITPDEVNLKITKIELKKNVGYSKFKYDLITKVSVDLLDLRNEITNHDYYINIYDSNGNLNKSYNYVELLKSNELKGVLKNIELDENSQYTVDLGIKIRDRYYSINSFEMSTENEVVGVSNTNEWTFIQPRGNYIVLNDISFKNYTAQTLGWGYKYFYGTIDFQGYTMSLYTSNSTFQRIGRVEKSGVLKNLVLDVYMDNEVDSTVSRGFVATNYGTIESTYVNIYDYRVAGKYDSYFSSLCDSNSGTIKNFVINLATKVHLYNDAAALVRYNYGTIKEGYAYGENIITNVDLISGSARTVSVIQRYGGTRSTISNVYSLVGIEYPNNNVYDYGGILSWETYGNAFSSYVVGNVNENYPAYGPAIGVVRTSADIKDVYYVNKFVYTNQFQNKISSVSLNDSGFQRKLLGNNFEIEDIMKLGYYPHVKFQSPKMPTQPYIDLPSVTDDNLVDIISSDVIEQTYNSAKLSISVNNPDGDAITNIDVSDINATILSQTYENGKSTVIVKLEKPAVYVSRYAVRSISSKDFSENVSTRKYVIGEKYIFVDLYGEVGSVADWIKINDKRTQNFVITEDIDFMQYSNYYISTFSGKIEGNNHILKNINIVASGKSGLFEQMNGTLQNIYFENVYKSSDSTYAGLSGYSNSYGKFENVHITKMNIEVPSERVNNALYAGALVGYANASSIINSSVNGIKISSRANIIDIAIGGLVGNSYGTKYSNSFAANVDIYVNDAINTLGVGGLVGREYWEGVGIIDYCYSTGKVFNNGMYTGGLAGYGAGYISNSYSSVNVTSDLYNIGGITGYGPSMSYLNNNLYVGNIFTLSSSSINILGAIAANIDANETNYVLKSLLINGWVGNLENTEDPNNIRKGASLVTSDQLKNELTYTDSIELGEQYDYSDVSQGILPKLYYYETEELLPNQSDNKLFINTFNVNNMIINKNPTFSGIVLYIDNPDNYAITGVAIDDMDIQIKKNNIENGISVIELDAYPIKYYDSYKLSRIYYEENGETKSIDKNIKIDMIFYNTIDNIDEWNAVSKINPENYILTSDLDFTGKSINTGVVFNRLETINDTEYHTISGISLTYTKNASYHNIIQKVVTRLKNVEFKDISIVDQTTSGNSYNNIIMYNYGELKNLKFNNITINSPAKYYVAIVGRNYSYKVDTIELNKINVRGYYMTAALISYAENMNDRKYQNITATDIHINGSSSYTGGIFGYMSGWKSSATYEVSNINISNSEILSTSSYVGGITGFGECNNCIIDNVSVKGVSYVGGAVGQSRNAYINNVVVKNKSKIEGSGYYIGGLHGYGYSTDNSYFIDSTVTGTLPSTYAVGGLVGYFVGYTMYRSGVSNSTITANGYYVGGIIGLQDGGVEYNGFVNDTTVIGEDYTGGITGSLRSGYIRFSNVLDTTVNSTNSYAGGIIGYIRNQSTSTVYITEDYVGNTSVKSNINAGGLFGGMYAKFYNVNYINKLYFEGNINGTSAGIATGDEFDSYVTTLANIYFYEDSLINNVKLKYLVTPTVVSEDLFNSDIHDGFISDSTGEITTAESYPYAAYTDFIKLDANKTYNIGVTKTSGDDWFRIKIYDMDGNFVADSNSGGGKYFDYTRYLGYTTETTFKTLNDCYIRIFYINKTRVSKTHIYEMTATFENILKDQLLTTKDLRNRITWTRYADDGATIDYYYESKLLYSYSYYNFNPLNSDSKDIVVTDKSDNDTNGIGTFSGIDSSGAFFDGIDDNVVVENYTATPDFTISANIQNYTSKPYEFLFSSRDSTKSGNGIGMFVHYRVLYAAVNGSWYSTGYYIPYFVPTNVVATYSQNKILKVYVNGELIYQNSKVNKTVNTVPTAKTYISRDSNYSSSSYLYKGVISDIEVYDRELSSTEVMNNYSNGIISNTEGLKLYYNFKDCDYKGDGYYPKVKHGSTEILNQILSPLPSNNAKLLGKMLFRLTDTTLTNDLEKIYNIYSSGINTINIEFNEIPSNLWFKYKNGDYESEKIQVTKNVYSINYDYNSKIEFEIQSLGNTENVVIDKNDVQRTILLFNNDYYNIDSNILYKNGNKLLDNAVNIFNNLVLLDDGTIYNLETEEYQTPFIENGILSKEIPLYESIANDSILRSFDKFTYIIDKEGNSNIKDGKYIVKDDYLYIFNKSSNDKIVFNNYNNNEYQIALYNNHIKSLKTNIKYPKDFENDNIVEIAFDKNIKNPIILIKYDSGYIRAFNYYNGNIEFEYGTKENTSLFNFIASSFIIDNSVNINNNSYNENLGLIDKIAETKNKKVINELIIPSNNDANKEEIINDPDNEVNIIKQQVLNPYVTIYDSSENKYETYNIDSILDAKAETEVSINDKINNNAFLYNYFYSGTIKNIYQNNKVIIYLSLIVLALLNLILFTRHILNRGVKNEK